MARFLIVLDRASLDSIGCEQSSGSKDVVTPQIFVVSSDDDRRSGLLTVLSGAGYSASGASTFAEAKEALGTRSPDLVIADERLGAFNGLHVIMLGRANRPDMKAIVTTRSRGAGLETDARRLNVQCLVPPPSPAEWLVSISQTLDNSGGLTEASV